GERERMRNEVSAMPTDRGEPGAADDDRCEEGPNLIDVAGVVQRAEDGGAAFGPDGKYAATTEAKQQLVEVQPAARDGFALHDLRAAVNHLRFPARWRGRRRGDEHRAAGIKQARARGDAATRIEHDARRL